MNSESKNDKKRPSLFEMFRNSPLIGVDLDLERSDDLPREIDLGGDDDDDHGNDDHVD